MGALLSATFVLAWRRTGMIFDLEGWHQVNPKYPNRKLSAFLPVIGGNHSDHNLGFNSCWSADDEATFEEQLERVVSRMRRFDHDEDQLEKFLQQARDFRQEADAKGYKIVSEWI
jgi:hypothetical protein